AWGEGGHSRRGPSWRQCVVCRPAGRQSYRAGDWLLRDTGIRCPRIEINGCLTRRPHALMRRSIGRWIGASATVRPEFFSVAGWVLLVISPFRRSARAIFGATPPSHFPPLFPIPHTIGRSGHHPLRGRLSSAHDPVTS